MGVGAGRTFEILALGVDHLEHRLRVLLVAHRVEVEDEAALGRLEKVLEAGARDAIGGAAHGDLRALGFCPGAMLRVDERLIEIEHQVELLAAQRPTPSISADDAVPMAPSSPEIEGGVGG